MDVSGSSLLQDPEVLAAVEFAAQAHAGQTRKTGEPYVAHCIETALIVEQNLPGWRQEDRWGWAQLINSVCGALGSALGGWQMGS